MTDACVECGFVYDLDRAETAGDEIRALATKVVALLCDNEIEVRSHSDPRVWSPLEYACHLRDVLLVQRERVLAARRMNGIDCAPMGREERAEHDGYNEQDPSEVARQLSDAAALFGNDLARLSADDWNRTVVYHYPATNERSLRWVAVHTAHELQHHLLDIRRQL